MILKGQGRETMKGQGGDSDAFMLDILKSFGHTVSFRSVSTIP